MSDSFLQIQLDPDQSFAKAMEQALQVTDDLGAPFAEIAADFYRGQKAIWKQSSAGVYEDLADSTKKSKLKKYGFLYPILKASGKLEQAASIAGAEGNITDIGKKELVMAINESSVPYSIFHQEGTGKIPRRPFFFLGQDDADEFGDADQQGRIERWVGIIDSYLKKSLKESGMGSVS